MDAYDLDGGCQAVLHFIDALNNWYIRRSRERVWAARHERRQGRLLRHAVHGAHHPLPGRRAAAADADRDRLPRADRRAQRPPHRLTRRRRRWPATPPWSPPWTRFATSVRRCSRCAAPPTSGCACRSRRSRSRSPEPAAARALPRAHRRRGQRQGGAPDRRRRRHRAPRARRQRRGCRAAARRGGAEGVRGGTQRANGRLVDDGLEIAGTAPRGRRVHPGDPAQGRGDDPRPGVGDRGGAASTSRSPPSSSARAWRATWSAWCSRRVATPASTSPTGSALSSSCRADYAAAAKEHSDYVCRRDARGRAAVRPGAARHERPRERARRRRGPRRGGARCPPERPGIAARCAKLLRRRGAVAARRAHNPKVAGSSPAAAMSSPRGCAAWGPLIFIGGDAPLATSAEPPQLTPHSAR